MCGDQTGPTQASSSFPSLCKRSLAIQPTCKGPTQARLQKESSKDSRAHHGATRPKLAPHVPSQQRHKGTELLVCPHTGRNTGEWEWELLMREEPRGDRLPWAPPSWMVLKAPGDWLWVGGGVGSARAIWRLSPHTLLPVCVTTCSASSTRTSCLSL